MIEYKRITEEIKQLMNTPEKLESAKKTVKQAEESAERLVKSMRAKTIWRIFNA